MINNIELFNVAEAKKCLNGYMLNRYPESIQAQMNPHGAMIAGYSCGCEIRFVKEEAGTVRINLIAECGNCNAVIFRGDRTERVLTIPKGEFFSIDISENNTDNVKNKEFFKNDVYSKEVVRIVFQSSRIILCGIETFGRKIRPPKKEELPAKTMLAYGSSITHGSASISSPLTYASTTARLLRAQMLNKGLGGSCFCENAVADYFAQNIDYDFMIFEHGTNMCGNFTLDEIRERGKYMLDRLFEKNPDKYIFLITPPMPRLMYDEAEKYKALADTVKEVGQSVNTDKCVLVEAEKFETDTAFVTTDLIHPSSEGHMMMGINLAGILKPYIEK